MFRKIGLRTLKTAISIGLGMVVYLLLKSLDQGLGLYNTASQPDGFRFSDFFSPFFAGIASWWISRYGSNNRLWINWKDIK